jgi:hypothetical protein
MARVAPGVRLALCSQQGAHARERTSPAALPFATSESRGAVGRIVVATVHPE